MGEVIVGIDAPLVTGLVVMGMANAVQDRIAQVHVGRRHVDLGAQHACAVGELAGFHACEQVEALIGGTLAERAVLARLGEVAAVFARLLGGQIADIRLAGLDQLDGPVVQLVKVLRGIALFTGPLETQPLDVGLDRIDVLLVFLGRVGVVEAQVAGATEFLSQAEVHADRLGVADVQVAIGLRREARDDAGVFARVQISLHDGAQKVGRNGRAGLVSGVGRGVSGWLAHGILENASARPG